MSFRKISRRKRGYKKNGKSRRGGMEEEANRGKKRGQEEGESTGESAAKRARPVEEVAPAVAREFQTDVAQIQDIPRVEFQAPYSNANIIENMMDVISRGAATGAVAAATGAQAITDLVTIVEPYVNFTALERDNQAENELIANLRGYIPLTAFLGFFFGGTATAIGGGFVNLFRTIGRNGLEIGYALARGVIQTNGQGAQAILDAALEATNESRNLLLTLQVGLTEIIQMLNQMPGAVGAGVGLAVGISVVHPDSRQVLGNTLASTRRLLTNVLAGFGPSDYMESLGSPNISPEASQQRDDADLEQPMAEAEELSIPIPEEEELSIEELRANIARQLEEINRLTTSISENTGLAQLAILDIAHDQEVNVRQQLEARWDEISQQVVASPEYQAVLRRIAQPRGPGPVSASLPADLSAFSQPPYDDSNYPSSAPPELGGAHKRKRSYKKRKNGKRKRRTLKRRKH